MAPRIIRGFQELRGLVGQEISVGEWFTLTQEQITAFAELLQDHQWIHVDTQRARAELPGGKTIAHGFLTLSLLSHLLKKMVVLEGEFNRAINYGLNRVRFPSPVPADSQLRLRCTLASVEDVPGGIQICWAATMELKNVEKPAMVAEWLMRYYF